MRTNKLQVFQMFSKRQRFIFSVGLLAIGLFYSDTLFGKSGTYFSFFLALLTDIFLLIANYRDIRQNFSWVIFIIPFFYTLSFGLFYFLAPERLFAKIILTALYAIGMYALFLTQNIFTIATFRTIPLLPTARTFSLAITLVSYFFLTNIIFTLHLPVLPTIFLATLASFFLVRHAIWTITLEGKFFARIAWVSFLTLCLFETAVVLWFWPADPTVIAIFLAGMFYTVVGPTQVWLDKRFFRGVVWGYLWVALVVFLTFASFTSWRPIG